MIALDAGIARLREALDLSLEGEVVIVVVEADFAGELVPDPEIVDGVRLLHASSVSEALGLHGAKLTEIRFPNDPSLPLEELRWLNQQREQLRRQGAVVFRLPAEQAGRFARYAPDLWRWATVLDLTNARDDLRTLEPRPATGRVEERPYAPSLDPTLVETPTHDLTDAGLDKS